MKIKFHPFHIWIYYKDECGNLDRICALCGKSQINWKLLYLNKNGNYKLINNWVGNDEYLIDKVYKWKK